MGIWTCPHAETLNTQKTNLTLLQLTEMTQRKQITNTVCNSLAVAQFGVEEYLVAPVLV